jgi:hypothetical protein
VRGDGALNTRVDVGVARVVGAVHAVRVARAVRDVEIDLAVFAALVGGDAGADGGCEVFAEV